MTMVLDRGLHDLLTAMDEDHQRVTLALEAAPTPPPVDEELAALAAELRRLRWLEPDVSAMALLCDAASQHPEAVERHLAWLNSSTTPPLVVLPDALDVPSPAFRMAC